MVPHGPALKADDAPAGEKEAEVRASNEAQQLLDENRENFQELFEAYGNVGASIGVLKADKYGFLNIGKTKLAGSEGPKSDSIYLISSMTKPLMSLAVAILINDSKGSVTFDTPVSELLPSLKGKPSITLAHAKRELQLCDLLDLRSEFHKCTHLWESPHGDVPWQTVDPILSVLSHLPGNGSYSSPKSFINGRNYSNECFALAAAIIEAKSELKWHDFVNEKVLRPLGMKDSFACCGIGSETERMERKMVGSHSVRTTGMMSGLAKFLEESSKQRCTFGDALRYVQSSTFKKPESVEVAPSKVGCNSSDNIVTPIGAAAGIRSTVPDLLKFYGKFIDVYHQKGQARPGANEVELGISTIQQYLNSRTGASISVSKNTCTYAGGWNTVMVPWDEQQTVPKPRWPGADGDNARRLETAQAETVRDPTIEPPAPVWHFLAGRQPSVDKDLALYHGGNMVGATSFCFLVPEQRIAVVVLCNTRGFLVDTANLACMLLADRLYQRDIQVQEKSGLGIRWNEVKLVAKHIAASYIWALNQYEHTLLENYPEPANAEKYQGCIGTYKLCDGISAEVLANAADSTLAMRLYDQPFLYPLRLRAGSGPSDDRAVMTMAMPMDKLIDVGVGGNNRLDISEWTITFLDKKAGIFESFGWDFAKTGINPIVGDFGAFTFRRVASPNTSAW